MKKNIAPAPTILRNSGSGSNDLYFYEEFGPDWYGYISSDMVRRALSDVGGAPINVYINSQGGDVFEALAIYSLFKNYAGQKTAIITNAWSCASWVAQACDKRIMDENGLMMMHDPETVTCGNAADHQMSIDLLNKAKSTIQGTYASRSGQTPEAVGSAMSAESWYTAEEALAFGLIDEVSPNKGAPVTMKGDVSRFRNAPDRLKPIEPGTENWRRAMNHRRQLLNELKMG